MGDLAQRAETAGLNASAPPQQASVDGWLIRLSPGKAKRSRCVNALAAGSSPLDELLARCRASFDAAGLPLIVRVTPFSQPADLDALLAERGWYRFDDTVVMTLAALSDFSLPEGLALRTLDAGTYAATVGALRGSSPGEIAAHAQRLQASTVPYQGFLLQRSNQPDSLLACGQVAMEAGIVGLYDVFTTEPERGRGHARQLCAALLQWAGQRGAAEAYLQVSADNGAAQRVYRRLGFVDSYAYHYRSPNASEAR